MHQASAASHPPASRITLLLSTLSAAALLSGCLTGEPDPSAGPQGPMYRCIGEAPYEKGSWEIAMQALEADPPPCRDRETAEPVRVMSMLTAQEPSSGDAVRVHAYVMDSRCNFLTEYRSTQALSEGRESFFTAWDGRLGDGAPAPTGEYYVNTEVGWKNGGKDTTYLKIGLVNRTCP